MRLNRRVVGFALFALVCWAPKTAIATDSEFSLAKPYGECRLGFWNSNRNLDDTKNVAQTQCLLNWKPRISPSLQANFNLRAAAVHGEPSPLAQAPSAAIKTSALARFREAYVQADMGDVSVRAGRQIIAWGRADRVSPTDVLSPRDFTMLTAEDDEQRKGIDAVSGKYQINSEISATAIVNRFEAHTLPLGQLPASLVTNPSPQDTEWSLRLDRTGTGWDAALSYFDGRDRSPRYWANVSGSGISFARTYERHRLLGADFATSLGRWTLRAEAALIKASPDCAACPLKSRDIKRWVLGTDRDFGDASNINVQLFGVSRDGYAQPSTGNPPATLIAINQGLDRLNSEYGSHEWGVTVRWSSRFMNDRLRTEIAAIKEFKNGSSVLRPRLSYAINDSVTMRMGVDHFSGKAQSYFGSRSKNNIAYAEIAIQF